MLSKSMICQSGHFWWANRVNKYFLCGPFLSPGELSWNTFFVFLHPTLSSIGLLGSFAYSRCSIHVYQMKSLFLRAWWGSTAERFSGLCFPWTPLVWSHCPNGSWTAERLIIPWPLGVSGQCMGRCEGWGHPKVWWVWVHACVWGIVTLFGGLWEFPAGHPSHQGASIQNCFFSNSSVLKIPSSVTHPSDYSCPQKPQVKMGQMQGERASTPKWRPGWTREWNKKGNAAKKMTLLAFLNTLEGAFLLGSSNHVDHTQTLSRLRGEESGGDGPTESMRGDWERREGELGGRREEREL